MTVVAGRTTRQLGAWTTLLLTVMALVATTAGPASADARTFTDREDDAHRGLDIRSVRVVNEARILVRTQFDFINRNAGRGLSVYFDTDRSDHGPEYVASGGISDTRDWNAVRIEGWNDRNGHVLRRCDIDLRVRFGRHGVATFDIARGCFRHPAAIRVAAKAEGYREGKDWAPRRQQFYPTGVDHG